MRMTTKKYSQATLKLIQLRKIKALERFSDHFSQQVLKLLPVKEREMENLFFFSRLNANRDDCVFQIRHISFCLMIITF